MARKYDDVFKGNAVAMYHSFRPDVGTNIEALRKVSAETGVSVSALRSWLRDGVQPVEVEKRETLVEAFDRSVAAMSWLEASDDGLVALGRTYAEQIDQVLQADDVDAQTKTKTLYLGPHLVNALRELGGSPGTRKEITQGEGAVGGKLAQFRQAHRPAGK